MLSGYEREEGRKEGLFSPFTKMQASLFIPRLHYREKEARNFYFSKSRVGDYKYRDGCTKRPSTYLSVRTVLISATTFS